MAAKPLPLDDNEPLESEDEPMEGELEDDSEAADPMDSGIDPMFAADISEAFPEMDDAQVAALQRAVLGLISGGGGMGGPPPALPF